MAHLTIFHMAPGFLHFEPFNITDLLAAFRHGIIDRVFNTVFGRTDNLYFFINVVITHTFSFSFVCPYLILEGVTTYNQPPPKHESSMKSLRAWLYSSGLLIALVALGPLLLAASGSLHGAENWRTANRDSAGIAPDPAAYEEAIVQVYGARAWSWRGYFAVHTWISTKEAGADHYKVHEVTGWRRYVVNSRPDVPDRHWYGARPTLYADLRGPEAAGLIPDIEAAVQSYPWQEQYEAWPGPNSNTFVAWVIRETPGLDVALPSHAIGKDYLGASLVSETPGGLGYQLSLGGYFGVLAGVREGLELNILGLSLGINPAALSIKLPGLGELGLLNPNPMAASDPAPITSADAD
jgi:hypothetical protein